jgi:hypothetical protein
MKYAMYEAQPDDMNRDMNNESRKITGWLFDIYPLQDKMIFWIKQNNNNNILRMKDSWT